jgi:hypothetical protein
MGDWTKFTYSGVTIPNLNNGTLLAILSGQLGAVQRAQK